MEAAELPEPLPAAALRRPGVRVQLGALLLRKKLLSAEQLEEALAEKDETGDRLGEIVIRHGWVSGRALAHALAEQHELEYIDLAQTEIEALALSLLPERFARRYAALPIRFLGDDVVLVAVADPGNVRTTDELQARARPQHPSHRRRPDDLEQTIDRVYRDEVKVDDHDIGAHAGRDGSSTSATAATSVHAIELVNSIISRAIQDGASDIHFEPQANELLVRARIDGVMRRMTDGAGVDAGGRHRPPQGPGRAGHRRQARRPGRPCLDPLRGEPMDLRVAVLPTTHGEQVVLRILARHAGMIGLSELGMSAETEEAFLRAIRQPYGAVITCGPTGKRQDDDALLRTRPAERRRTGPDDDRGSGRVPDPGRQPDRGQLEAAG